MSTEATRQRKRVASLWDWAMPGLVMRVHGDCARNSLKQIETHIAFDDTSATLLKCLEITTDSIQHQIAVLPKYLEAKNKAECQEQWQRDRVEADDVARWKKATCSVHGDCIARARREMDDQRVGSVGTKLRTWIIEIVNVGGAFPTGKETRCGPARSGPQRYPQSESAHTALERETVFSSCWRPLQVVLRSSGPQRRWSSFVCAHACPRMRHTNTIAAADAAPTQTAGSC